MAVFIGILAAIVIGGLVGFVLMTAGAVFRIIMAPALRLPTRASGWPRPRVADLLCLMALLQVSLFPMALSGPIGGHAGALLFIGFAWTITVAIWWEGVKRLTALRVNETRRRVIFLIVVGPLAYGTAILCAVSVLVVVSILFASLYNVFDGSPVRAAWFLVWVAAAGSIIGVMVAIGRLASRWVVDAVPATAVPEEGVVEMEPAAMTLQAPTR